VRKKSQNRYHERSRRGSIDEGKRTGSKDQKHEEIAGKKRPHGVACLKFNGDHRLKDCPTGHEISGEERKKLFEELRVSRPRFKKMKESARSRDNDIEDGDDGRWTTLFEGKHQFISIADTGSDYSAIPRSAVDAMIKAGAHVKEKVYDQPKEVQVAFSTIGALVVANAEEIVDIKIQLPFGPSCLRRVPFAIIEAEMDETLLGRPLLEILGFSINDHFEKHAKKYHNMDVFSTIEAGQSVRSAVKAKRSSFYTGLRYGRGHDDPIADLENAGSDLCAVNLQEINTEIERMIRDATLNGMSNAGIKMLDKMFSQHRDIWRTRMAADPPAKVEPIQVELKPCTRPVRAAQRRFSPPQAAFIRRSIKELEACGALYSNPTAKWAIPVVAAPKPGSKSGFRFTEDLRVPNSRTQPMANPMPSLETVLQEVVGCTCFVNIDFSSAYWQIPLAKEAQEILSVQTPDGVCTTTRSLQGSSNAGQHFTAVTSDAFCELRSAIFKYLDDFLLHAKDENELLGLLQRFFGSAPILGSSYMPESHPYSCKKSISVSESWKATGFALTRAGWRRSRRY
jgi:Reverse transcriptase (RNA-dependent DNA polymerase)